MIGANELIAGLFGSGGVLIAQHGFGWLKARARTNADVDKHRDTLTIQMLTVAREEMAAVRLELAAAREEADELRALHARLAHFEEALDHIHALLNAEGAEEERAAERRATAFLNRMRRLADARGAIINEMQRMDSGARLPTEGGER